MQQLTPDQLLSTTRAVRKRLDFDRPVPREVLEECIALALQAPSASNSQPWSFVVVADPERKAAIAEWYVRAYDAYANARSEAAGGRLDPATERMAASARYLADRFADVPAMVIPCVQGRIDQRSSDGPVAVRSYRLVVRQLARKEHVVARQLDLMIERRLLKLTLVSLRSNSEVADRA